MLAVEREDGAVVAVVDPSAGASGGVLLGGGSDVDSYASDEHYGARNVQGTNITMPNGSCDPWHSLGVLEEGAPFYDESQRLAEGVEAVFIDGTAHCRDMYAPDVFAVYGIEDTDAVKEAHARVKANVYSYIGAN